MYTCPFLNPLYRKRQSELNLQTLCNESEANGGKSLPSDLEHQLVFLFLGLGPSQDFHTCSRIELLV